MFDSEKCGKKGVKLAGKVMKKFAEKNLAEMVLQLDRCFWPRKVCSWDGKSVALPECFFEIDFFRHSKISTFRTEIVETKHHVARLLCVFLFWFPFLLFWKT